MGVRFRLITTALAVLLFAFFVVTTIGGYWLHWDWTGFTGNAKSGKTFWDWLQLLIIPFALAIIAIFFNRSERKNEQRIASDNQQETALQEYIKEMSELFLHEDLLEADPKKAVRDIAKVQTKTILRRLDADRKGIVIQFLYDTGLIEIDLTDDSMIEHSIINLNKADLRGSNLSGAFLIIAYLFGADLRGANLSHAILEGANLNGADLRKANLSGANLNGADLRKANLGGAKVTEEQLAKAKSLKGATMPDGTKHD